MLKDDSDKIIVSKSNGTWIYFSVYDDNDNGTILDFLKHRTGRSIYQIGNELQSWIGQGLDISNQYVPNIKQKTYEPERIQRLFNYCRPTYNNSYLLNRGLTIETLRSDRFINRVFQDQFKNAAFPHFKMGKICGLELKGENTNLFVRGSEKSLWRSNRLANDHSLVITETPIDALSYYLIHEMKNGLYTSTCGSPSSKQVEIILNLVSQTQWIETIILATDNDEGGDRIAERLEKRIQTLIHKPKIKRHSPEKRGCDWNDVLNQLGI